MTGASKAAEHEAVLGDLLGPVGHLDSAGRIHADGFEVEWGVLAEDRWRLGHAERLRRRRLDDAPVYGMWMRVPGGDVILRVAVVNDGISRTLLLEFHNASPAPLLSALVCRRSALLEAGGSGITADGDIWVTASGSIGGVAASAASNDSAAGSDSDDIWARVQAEPDAHQVAASGEAAAAALMVALPHFQTTSFSVGIGGPPPKREVAVAEVASGWKAVTRRALTLSWPDPDLAEAWGRVVGDLVVLAGSDDPAIAAAVASRLDVAGLSAEADRARATVIAAATADELNGAAAVEALRSLASRDLVAGKPSGLDVLAGPLAHSAADHLDRHTLAMTAAALQSVSPAAAADARRLAGSVSRADPSPVALRPAAVASEIIGRLIADPWSTSTAELLPGLAAEWQGRDLEVDGLHTALGVLSFAVRWHGPRPALLWERIGGAEEALLSAVSLDAQWSASARSGEALLAPPA